MPYKNPEDRRAYLREYYCKNKDKYKKWSSEYLSKPEAKEKRRVRQTEWRKNNPDKSNAKARRHHRSIRLKVIEFLGGKCCRCGFNDWRALQIDHVDGGGTYETSVKFRGALTTYYKHVIKTGGAGYQLLCANCNWIKKYENGEDASRRSELYDS